MNKSLVLLLFVLAALVVACQPKEEAAQPEAAAAEPEVAPEPEAAPVPDRLAAVLDAQPEETKARYPYRHPRETIEFFGIEPGMTVLEGLPGRGWYTKILLPYLGSDGTLIAANYSLDLYPNFSFMTPERLAEMQTWATDWPTEAAEWGGEDGASIAAYHMGSLPAELEGSADAIFFARVLHNMARFEAEGVSDFLTVALEEAYRILKPGGVFGIVQHHARDEMPDDWANGSNGYLKKQFVIDKVTAAGFEFVDDADFNANPNDQPTTEDFVWRLPPSLVTSGEDEELRAQYTAIGETNRMTLKFRKPE